MRFILLVFALTLNLSGAEVKPPSSHDADNPPEMIAASKVLDAAEGAYVESIVKLVDSWNIQTVPVPKLGPDPRQSERDAVKAAIAHNSISENVIPAVKRFLKPEMRKGDWREQIQSFVRTINKSRDSQGR